MVAGDGAGGEAVGVFNLRRLGSLDMLKQRSRLQAHLARGLLQKMDKYKIYPELPHSELGFLD